MLRSHIRLPNIFKAAIFNIIGILLIVLFGSAGCSSQPSLSIDSAEPAEIQKSEDPTIQQFVRRSITDPIYDVAEAACRFKNAYGHWPSVDFYTNPASPFVSFYSSGTILEDYETVFQLRAFPFNLKMIVSQDEGEEAAVNCRIKLLIDRGQKENISLYRILSGKPRTSKRYLEIFDGRLHLGRSSDRDDLAASFVLVARQIDIRLDPSLADVSAKENSEAVQSFVRNWGWFIKASLCLALRVNSNQCY